MLENVLRDAKLIILLFQWKQLLQILWLLLQKGEFIPPCVGVGEKVLLPEYGGTKISFDDKVAVNVYLSVCF